MFWQQALSVVRDVDPANDLFPLVLEIMKLMRAVGTIRLMWIPRQTGTAGHVSEHELSWFSIAHRECLKIVTLSPGWLSVKK